MPIIIQNNIPLRELGIKKIKGIYHKGKWTITGIDLGTKQRLKDIASCEHKDYRKIKNNVYQCKNPYCLLIWREIR